MIEFRGIGQCALLVGEMRLSPASETLFALTSYLVLEAGRAIPRAEIAALFWPSAREDRSGHRLRQLIYRLNQAGAGLRCDRGTIELPREHVDSDVARLAASFRDTTVLELLEDDRGSAFLPGFEPRISDGFTHWLERQRDFVSRFLTRAFSEELVLRKNRGDWRGAERLASKCLRLDPLNEEATLVLAEAAAAAGSKSRALSILARYVDELGPTAGEFAQPATVLRQRIAEWPSRQQHAVCPPPLVGRDEELSELFRQLSISRTGAGAAVVVSGEQGVGKSRLISEVLARASIRNHAVASAICEPHDRRRVLATIIDLTAKLLETPGALGSAPESLAHLRRLVDQQLEPTESADDTEFAASMLRRAFLDLLDSVCAETPLAIAIEDAQWLDTASQLFLLRSTRELLCRRILLLVSTRDRRRAAEWLASIPGSPIHIRLGPLQQEASIALVKSALAQAGRAESPEFVDWCVAYAGGNPLYLMQLAAHATVAKGRFSPPASLRSLLTDRIAQLSPTANGLLRACCVLGRQTTFARLERLLGETRASFIGAIDELERAGFTSPHANGISCRHELLARVVLDELTPAARRTLHRHAAEALEQESQEHGRATLWECSRHWEAAGNVEKAVALLRACAQLSLSMGEPAEAASMLAHAYTLARDPNDCLDILRERCVALQLADRWEDVAATVSQADRLLLTVERPVVEHADMETLRLEAGWHTGRPFAGLLPRAIHGALRCDTTGSRRLRSAALALILADNLYDAREVQALFNSLSNTISREDLVSRGWHHVRMIYHSAFGLHDAVPTAVDDLLAAARNDGNPATITRCLRHAAIAHSISSSIASAITLAIEAHEVATQARLANAIAASATALSSLNLRVERLDEAQHWYARATEQATTNSSPMAGTVRLGIGARLAIRAGDLTKARNMVTDIQRIVLDTGSVRASAELAAMRTEIALAEEQRTLPLSHLHNLQRLHLKARSFSGHDYFVGVMLDALRSKGLADQAEHLAGEYLNRFRREATDPPPRFYAALGRSLARVAEAGARSCVGDA